MVKDASPSNMKPASIKVFCRMPYLDELFCMGILYCKAWKGPHPIKKISQWGRQGIYNPRGKTNRKRRSRNLGIEELICGWAVPTLARGRLPSNRKSVHP